MNVSGISTQIGALYAPNVDLSVSATNKKVGDLSLPIIVKSAESVKGSEGGPVAFAACMAATFGNIALCLPLLFAPGP